MKNRSAAPPILDHTHLVRMHTSPLPYDLMRRVLDRRDGVVDGLWDRRTNRSAWADSDESEAVTMWAARLESTFSEQADQELMTLRAVEAPHQARRDALSRQLPSLESERDNAQHAREKIADVPSDPTGRGIAEQDDPESVILARRSREHLERIVRPAQAALESAQSQFRAASTEIDEIDATIFAARDVAVARVRRLKDHTERRISVYRRAWMRSWQRGSHHSGDQRRAPAAIRVPELLHLPDWAIEHLQHRAETHRTPA